MLAEHPDGGARWSKTILEHAGVGRLAFGIRTNVQIHVAYAAGLVLAENVVDGNSGKVAGTEHVDRSSSCCSAGNGIGTECLLVVSPVLLADESEGFGGAEVWLYQVAIGDGGNLRARVEMLGKSGNTGVG